VGRVGDVQPAVEKLEEIVEHVVAIADAMPA